MPKAEMEFQVPPTPWEQPPASPGGIWEKVLSHDAVTGDMSLLQRYEPGAASAAHVIRHGYWEEVYLIEGNLKDISLGTTFTAGMYACRPPGMPHGPYSSQSGCLMYVETRH